MRIPYPTAITNSTANKFCKYPSRKDDRLEPIAQPSFTSCFQLNAGDKVVTMGSCFARNIEEYLGDKGFVVPVLGYNGPREESGTMKRVQGILNKYTIASICQELEWVKTVKDHGGIVSWELIEPFVFEVADNQFLDLQLSTTCAVGKSRLIERRQSIYDIHVQILDCDLAILTPGLTEAWYDNLSGIYIQRAPTRQMVRADPNRYSLEVLDFFRCYEMLERAITLLRETGTRQIALTVSPVPLERTMTDKDILIANMYSKSTLRSVVGLLSDCHDFVHYVPSYEKVMLSKSLAVWQDDLRHVADSFVGEIVSAFLKACGPKIDDDLASKCAEFNTAFEAGRKVDALNFLEAIGPHTGFAEEFKFHFNACILLMENSQFDNALIHAKAMQTIRPQKAAGYVKELNILLRQGRRSEARVVAENGLRKCDNASKPHLVKRINKVFGDLLPC